MLAIALGQSAMLAHLDPVQVDNGAAELVDFLGVNKYYGWYLGHGMNNAETTEGLINCLQGFYDTFKKPILLAEFGADCVAGMGAVPEQAFGEGFQTELVIRQAQAVEKLPYILGVHLWNFADFATGQQLNRAHGNNEVPSHAHAHRKWSPMPYAKNGPASNGARRIAAVTTK